MLIAPRQLCFMLSRLLRKTRLFLYYIIATCWTASRTSFDNSWVLYAPLRKTMAIATQSRFTSNVVGMVSKILLLPRDISWEREEFLREKDTWLNQLTNVGTLRKMYLIYSKRIYSFYSRVESSSRSKETEIGRRCDLYYRGIFSKVSEIG